VQSEYEIHVSEASFLYTYNMNSTGGFESQILHGPARVPKGELRVAAGQTGWQNRYALSPVGSKFGT
jgi:hypothetical protein